MKEENHEEVKESEELEEPDFNLVEGFLSPGNVSSRVRKPTPPPFGIQLLKVRCQNMI